MELQNHIRAYRERRGWTQEDLARRIGVGRQAVYDMESGRYLPNTAVALRLAGVFGTSVESLFTPAARPGKEDVRIVCDSPRSGMRLAIGRVRGGLVGLPLHGVLAGGDGFVDAATGEVSCVTPPDLLEQTLLVAGCNPALELLDGHIRRELRSARVRTLFASSGQALRLLAQGGIHAGAVHFHDAGTHDANAAAAQNALGGAPCTMLGFSVNEEGLMVAKGNPLGIRSVADLARRNVRFANRETGAALRKLLDDALAASGIPAGNVPGYHTVVRSHEEGAFRVFCGAADAALGLRAVSETAGLDFVPMAATRCDLAVPDDLLANPLVAVLLNVLASARLRREMAALPGIDSV